MSTLTVRRLTILLVALTCGACGGSAAKSDGGVDANPDGNGPSDLSGTLVQSRKLDILFVIEDATIASAQQKFITQMPVFAQTLAALPGGLPDLHVAVISADMGSGTGSANIGCSMTGGDDGIFKSAPQGTCTNTTLTAGATFVADDAAGTTKNFTLDDSGGAGLASVLECIGLLGSSGCGIPQPLAAAARALGADGLPPPGQNAGFLRDDAALAIILLTDQDDCSLPPGSDLFSDSSTTIADPLGPLTLYRCIEFGHLCDGQPPPRLSPDPSDLDTTVSLQNCESNEDGMLTPIATLAAGIRALKADPGRILTAAITGPPTPDVVTWTAPSLGVTDTQPWPSIEQSCMNMGDGSAGDPSVRTAQWLAAFGDQGALASICDNSYASSMSAIAAKAGALVSPPCLTDTVRQDSDGQPQCTVTEHAGGTDQFVPSCLTSVGAAPCWTLATDASLCPGGGAAFTVSADPNAANPTTVTFSYSCVACPSGVASIGCP
jgi:hypothetical protein